MQVSLTATGGLERRLEVALPAQRVESEIEQRLKRISRTARLKGFRPGKAPITVVRKQFGEKVRAEVVGDLMRSSFAEAVNQEKLRPAAGPRIEPIAMEPGSDLRYAAVFEVMPEVKVAPLDSIAVDRPAASVAEEDVDAMVENMRRQRPNFVEVQRAAQDEDRVTVDIDARIEGASFPDGEGRDVSFIVGQSGQKEFDETVRGAAAGETRTTNITFPESHANQAVAGKTAEFQITVKKVEEQQLPEVDEEFCRSFGIEEGGVPALRAEVRRIMERELQDLIRNYLRNQVMTGLHRGNTIEVPRSLVEEQIRQLQFDAARRAGIRDASQLPPRQRFEEPARRRVALGLIIAEIVRSEGLKVDRERVQARLDEIAGSYPNPEEVRRAYLENADAMRQIESAVLEDQVVDLILSRARVTERAMTFKELTGFGQTSEA